MATLLLLAVTTPVFLAAALATLPVLLLVGSLEGLRRFRAWRHTAPRRRSC